VPADPQIGVDAQFHRGQSPYQRREPVQVECVLADLDEIAIRVG
jgi:hypothetical protein